ncbi:MAG: chromosome condensation regulator [Hyperionvirus sp.]|uniref:Chromosome condensation regulator n=1 Tax=Hyperionvirus sp. TaxID=2487770 RepID=A0A3G5A6U3_9VIRU|nr:MAG: chromosome condensation regulator [Hyperionvirus sp.]
MDIISLIKDLPLDLQYIVINYDPLTLFHILSISELTKYDWFRLIKMNFSLSYSRETSTNHDIMKVYLDYCDGVRSRVTCGGHYTIIKCRDGTLMSCGNKWDRNYAVPMKYVFEEIRGIPKNIVEVSNGHYHSIIRLTDGTLMGCGNNEYGQLGLGHEINVEVWKEIKGIPKNIKKVICYGDYSIILLVDGTLMGCGSNYDGQMGFGDRDKKKVFEEIKGIPRDIVQIACGAHIIIKLKDGTLMGCGKNLFGQLGFEDGLVRTLFEEIKKIPKNIMKVACGVDHTMILLADGTLMGCGNNDHGELGLGDRRDRNIFEEIKGIGKNIADVICGYEYTFIKLTDGTLMSCGANSIGQLGCGDFGDRNMFKEVKGIGKKVEEVICDCNHTVIRLIDGTLMSCGYNMFGQLGLEGRDNRNVFEEIKQINFIEKKLNNKV